MTPVFIISFRISTSCTLGRVSKRVSAKRAVSRSQWCFRVVRSYASRSWQEASCQHATFASSWIKSIPDVGPLAGDVHHGALAPGKRKDALLHVRIPRFCLETTLQGILCLALLCWYEATLAPKGPSKCATFPPKFHESRRRSSKISVH